MKLAVGFLLCLGTALSYQGYENSFSYRQNLFESFNDASDEQRDLSNQGRQLTYLYDGQAMTGIPGTSKQHSGNRLRATVTVTCKHQQSTCVLQLHEPRMGRLNRHVAQPDRLLPTGAFEPIPLEPQQRQKLSLPVKFSYTNGEINNIFFDGEERPWSANIKRGVLNMLQVKLNPKQAQSSVDIVDEVEDQVLNAYKPSPRDAQFYRTIEDTIEGKCEATYTVITPPEFKSAPQEIVNVTKTINFEKCYKRPQLKQNFHFSTPCDTCQNKYTEDQKFLKSSSISSYQVVKTRKSQIVNNAQTESQYVFVPFNEDSNTIVTYVSQNLNLLRAGVPTRRVKVPVNPIRSNTDMLYNMDAGIGREHFQMTGDSSFLEQLSYDKRENKVQLAKYLLKKLVNNLQDQVQEPATARFIELVNLFRMMPRHQIEQVHRQIEQGQMTEVTGRPGQSKAAMDLFHDALGSAGTLACVQHLVQKTKQRQMSISKAISAVKNMRNTRVPSQEMIDELISLAESPVSQRHDNLKQATWLTVGSLMHILCASNSDQWSIESQESIKKYCPTTLKQKYVKILIKKLHSSHKWDDQLIYVKALSNAGIDLSVYELEKVINNKNFNYRNMIRSEAILALRQLVSVMPKKIQKILMPIVANKLESEDVRITATYMVLLTQPKRNILDQLAKLSHNEQNLQVASFIDSSMRTLANSSNPCEQEFANNVKLSLRQTHKIYTRPANSKQHRVQWHSKEQRLGVDLGIDMSFKSESSLPRQLAASLDANYLGFWKNSLLGAKLSTEGLEQLFEQFEEEQYETTSYGSQFSWNKLASPMNILGEKYRNKPSSEPKAVFSLKFKNQEVGFMPIKRQTLESWVLFGRPGQGRSLEMAQRLKRGLSVNYNKATVLDEILFKIPTTMGVPVMVHIKVPAVINVHGAVKVTPSPSGSYGAFQVKALLKPSLVASISVDAQVWSPIVATGVNVVSKIKAQQPIDAKLKIDLKSETKKVHLIFTPPKQQKTLISIETRPTTFTIVQPKQVLARQAKQKRLILGEEGNRVETIHKCGESQSLGTSFCIKGRYHKTPKNSEIGSTFAPLSGPNKIVLSIEPTPNRPTTVAVNFYGKFLQPASMSSIKSSRLFSSMSSVFSSVFSGQQTSMFSDALFGEQVSPQVDSLMAQAARDNKVHSSKSFWLSDRNSKRPLENSLRIEIENGQQQQSSSFDLVHVFNMDGDFQKVQAKIRQSPNAQWPQQWKMCLNYETVFPTVKMTRHLRNGETIGKMTLKWGQSCQSDNFIRATKRLEKGQNSKLHEMQNPEWKVHQEANLKHGQLLKSSPLKHIYEIDYNNVPLKTKTMLNWMLRMVQQKYRDQTRVAENRVQNRPQHIKVIVAYDPITLKKGDVLVKTPKSTTLIKDFYMPSYATPVTHKNDYYENDKKNLNRQSLNRLSTAQCYASEYTVKTFQDTERPLPQSQSYKVLSQDCQSNLYTVLVRQLGGLKNQKEVKINTPQNQVTLRPSQWQNAQMKVYINGHDYSKQNNIVKTEAGIPILKIVKQNSHVKVEILTAGVSVYFDRKSVNVEVPPHKRHNQCGICGQDSRSQEQLFGYQSENAMESLFSRQIESDMLEQEIDNMQRDFSSTDDILSHYFGFSPKSSRFFEQQQQDEPRDYFWQWSSEGKREEQHGWSQAEERKWEIEEKESKSDKWDQFDDESINSEFNTLYSPLSQIEQQINEELFRTSEQSWQEQDQQFWQNPYLRQNFLIDEQSCQYMPFWQRQESGCNNNNYDNIWQSEQRLFDATEREMTSDMIMGSPSMREIEQEIDEQSQWRTEKMMEDQQDMWSQLTPAEQLYEQEDSWFWQQPFSSDRRSQRKNKVVETEHEICFSKRPIRCPDDFDVARQTEQTVEYVCLPRQSTRAQKFLNEVTSGRGQVQTQLVRMATTMTRREVVPTECRPNY